MRWAELARRGYYDQHQDEALDPDPPSLEEVARSSPTPRSPRRACALSWASSSSAATTSSSRSACSPAASAAAWRWPSSSIQPTNVLVLDEPTNHLDRDTRRKLIEVLEPSTTARSSAPPTTPAILERVATRVYEVSDGECRELIDYRKD